MNKSFAAAPLVFAADTALAWWVKGDLEMAWLIGMPLIIAGGVMFGALTGLLFRRWKPTALAVLGSAAWSMALAAIAIYTPSSWAVAPGRGLLNAAERFKREPAAIRAACEKVTGYPVELKEPVIDYSPGWVKKEGFSFRMPGHPAEARVIASFDAGPAGAFAFQVTRRGSQWELAPVRAQPQKISFDHGAFERRFSNVRLIGVGGNGPYSPGDLLPVRLARSETDWEIVTLRVAENGDVLREVRRYGHAEIMAGIARAVERRGLGPVEEVRIDLQIDFLPAEAHQVLFEAGPQFPFVARLNNPRQRVAVVQARLAGSELGFEVEFPAVRASSPR